MFDHVSVFEILSAERVNWYFTVSAEGVNRPGFCGDTIVLRGLVHDKKK